MLIKRTERHKLRGSSAAPNDASAHLDRRAFLRHSGLAAGSLAALGVLPFRGVRKANAGPPPASGAAVTLHKKICTHCAVGCTVTAEVSNGVWIGQEPSWESPINRGSHCAKGASVRELVHSERRLKYPMKLSNGQWTRVSWDQAISEIGDKMLEIRRKSGPESVYWMGSAKFSNEGAYLFRKIAAFWGTFMYLPWRTIAATLHARARVIQVRDEGRTDGFMGALVELPQRIIGCSVCTSQGLVCRPADSLHTLRGRAGARAISTRGSRSGTQSRR